MFRTMTCLISAMLMSGTVVRGSLPAQCQEVGPPCAVQGCDCHMTHPAFTPPHQAEACSVSKATFLKAPAWPCEVAGGLDGLFLRPCISQQCFPEETAGLHPPGFFPTQEAGDVIPLSVTLECCSRCTAPRTLGWALFGRATGGVGGGEGSAQLRCVHELTCMSKADVCSSPGG